MNELLNRAYNCYLVYLDNLNYGKVDQNYCLLYDAVLTIANNIDEEKYMQYFVANLLCASPYNNLEITDDMDRIMAWTLNSSETVTNEFDWHEISTPTNKTYPINTNTEVGFRFFYLSVPQGTNFIVTNELNMQLYDSALPADNPSQIFSLMGTVTMDNGQTNNVYRKDDVYNASNSVLFNVKLY